MDQRLNPSVVVIHLTKAKEQQVSPNILSLTNHHRMLYLAIKNTATEVFKLDLCSTELYFVDQCEHLPFINIA